MLYRILLSALVAGVLGGVAVAIIQAGTTTPLILEAEAYEGGAEAVPAMLDGAGLKDPGLIFIAASDDADEEWMPTDGLERTVFTSIATIGATSGFALILLSLMVLSGAEITARKGLMWGAAAFVGTGLAPALGLSPELPGSAAAALEARQLWWIGTAIATGAGLWLALRISTPAAIGVGVLLIAAPHVVGAPHPSAFTSTVPGELSGHFASASLVVQALSWALAGAIGGYVWQRLAARAEPMASAA
ncbi:CbtA family protein [Acuticoccus mangrovi]|uniref:CbtA family protein n=1 Tax=Acuticoccus mangrovi TaxID=2796142 RepID=A0A934MG94_9HYPH|nr:CbtA family protein [Acuticoccus mangrovi]MBJ3776323.1 CbtA family protein [Acuticoccus mangrovi]